MMASFDIVNYSLRPSKSIQRQIVFDGVRLLQQSLDLDRLVYVGFGSVWFTDFMMAHKQLNVDDMISIEANDIGYVRARFNMPYATVDIRHGFSYDVLPALYDDQNYARRPWMIWLDFDHEFNEELKQDVRSVIENAPDNSVFLITFDGKEKRYGEAADRPQRLRSLFGDVVPDDLSKDVCKDERMWEILANYATDFMQSTATDYARPGGFVPAFRIIYKDSAPMVTVGGVLPSKGAKRTAANVITLSSWPCLPAAPIVAPHLTLREAALLQAQLPNSTGITRELVKSLGFDLEEQQIKVFEKYYRQYPAFAQIIS